MASLAGVKSASGTLVAATVDTVTLSVPYNIVTVVNESSTGVINFTVDGTTPATDGFVVGPNSSVTVTVPLRQQGETAQVNGVASPNRVDTVTTTSGSSLVLDSSILSADAGKKLGHIPGTPSAFFVFVYVGTVVNATSFVAVNAAGTPVPAIYTGSNAQYNIFSPTTTLSGSTFVRGVDAGNVLSNPAVTTNTVVKLISAGTPTYSVVGG